MILKIEQVDEKGIAVDTHMYDVKGGIRFIPDHQFKKHEDSVICYMWVKGYKKAEHGETITCNFLQFNDGVEDITYLTTTEKP